MVGAMRGERNPRSGASEAELGARCRPAEVSSGMVEGEEVWGRSVWFDFLVARGR